MRMTNEDFQAEVFRRSAAYQQHHAKRIRTMTRAAAAFAGCLLLTVGIGFGLSRGSLNAMRTENMAADTASDAAKDASSLEAEMECDSEADYAAVESSEDCCDEVSGADNTNGDKADGASENSASDRDSSLSMPKQAAFVRKSKAEILERYGLDALPETIGVLSLTEDSSDSFYEVHKYGFIVSETEPDRILSDENTWLYTGHDQTAELTLYTRNGADMPVSYTADSDYPETNAETAAFAVNGIGVRLNASGVEHEALEQIVAELTDYLKEHTNNG